MAVFNARFGSVCDKFNRDFDDASWRAGPARLFTRDQRARTLEICDKQIAKEWQPDGFVPELAILPGPSRSMHFATRREQDEGLMTPPFVSRTWVDAVMPGGICFGESVAGASAPSTSSFRRFE